MIFDVPDSLRVNFEGIMFSGRVNIQNLYYSQFIRCCFCSRLGAVSNSRVVKNTSLYHCFVYGLESNGFSSSSSSMNFTSSVVAMYGGTSDIHFDFTNCILIPTSLSSGSYSTFRNCIFIGKQSNGSYFQVLELSSSGLAFNCVSLNSTDIFSKQINQTNLTVSDSISSIFKTYKGEGLPFNENFAPTDSATSVFLGSDSTQEGIYGGSLPFKTIPSYPHVTLFDVADKTDSQGNLNIKLEVSSGE